MRLELIPATPGSRPWSDTVLNVSGNIAPADGRPLSKLLFDNRLCVDSALAAPVAEAVAGAPMLDDVEDRSLSEFPLLPPTRADKAVLESNKLLV
mmetsp:Transcript_10850/g.15995  ORF Transcript_10850/g.15995 Transcript_10850/m.15995 type:complete len:95 (+) Transcript_10850:2886-3170(+)